MTSCLMVLALPLLVLLGIAGWLGLSTPQYMPYDDYLPPPVMEVTAIVPYYDIATPTQVIFPTMPPTPFDMIPTEAVIPTSSPTPTSTSTTTATPTITPAP